MNPSHIAQHRLASQHIAGTTFTTVPKVVGWMSAIQAQDYAMAKWAVGVRVPGATDASVEVALNSGTILRTHVLRPTWHLVAAEDIHWMLALTAPHIKASQRARHAELELTPAVLKKTYGLLEKNLRDGNHLTREELNGVFERAKISLADNRAAHLLMCAELDCLIASGATKQGKPTYTLLDERVPKPKRLSKDEALAALAGRYFASHGPATLADFGWWSGLPVGEARKALEMAKPKLICEAVGDQTYWFTPASKVPANSAHLLPAYDEFIISYKDRSALLTFEQQKKAVSDNGIFRPMVVVNGEVIGIWKRTAKKNSVLVEAEYFGKPNKAILGLIEHAAEQYGEFLGKTISSGFTPK